MLIGPFPPLTPADAEKFRWENARLAAENAALPSKIEELMTAKAEWKCCGMLVLENDAGKG